MPTTNAETKAPTRLKFWLFTSGFILTGLMVLMITLLPTSPIDSSAQTQPELADDVLDADQPLEKIKAQLDTLTMRTVGLEQRTESQHQQLAHVTSQSSQRQSQLAEISAQLTQFDQQLAQSQAQQEHLQSQLTHPAPNPEVEAQAAQLNLLEKQLNTLTARVNSLAGEWRKLHYQQNQHEAALKTLSEHVSFLTLALNQPPGTRSVQQTPKRPHQLPFKVTAIDRWGQQLTVTVAEPPLAGKRRVTFLHQGQHHLGWRVADIDERQQTVTFRHTSGQSIKAQAEG